MQDDGGIIGGLPDSDSEAMGLLVDRWLVALRESGASAWTLEQTARRLSRALDYGDHDSPEMAAFMDWAQGQDGAGSESL